MPTEQTRPSTYAFVLKLSDQPGGMELVAATFAHRGISLESTLGNDGTLDPEGRATMMVTFSASAAKKENIRRALGRLSRVRSLTEHSLDSPNLRKTAVFRVRGDVDAFALDYAGLWLERLPGETDNGDSTFLVVGTPAAVDAFLGKLTATGKFLDAAASILGL